MKHFVSRKLVEQLLQNMKIQHQAFKQNRDLRAYGLEHCIEKIEELLRQNEK